MMNTIPLKIELLKNNLVVNITFKHILHSQSLPASKILCQFVTRERQRGRQFVIANECAAIHCCRRVVFQSIRQETAAVASLLRSDGIVRHPRAKRGDPLLQIMRLIYFQSFFFYHNCVQVFLIQIFYSNLKVFYQIYS